jgi:hypothetical protein
MKKKKKKKTKKERDRECLVGQHKSPPTHAPFASEGVDQLCNAPNFSLDQFGRVISNYFNIANWYLTMEPPL